MKRIAVGQAGGPTAVINASLAGLLAGQSETFEVVAVHNGYEGLVKGYYELLSPARLEWIISHRTVPGACLGSGRYPLSDKDIELAVRQLKAINIDSLVFIGGNGTMAALHKISETARKLQYDLQVIGIPKTVDNDLGETDHTPGYGSAARFVALSVRDIAKDLEAMRNFEQVRIIETMGRNSGWLALAGGLLGQSDENSPHLICLPEVPLALEPFLHNVEELVRSSGMATIVVSEGCTFEGDDQVLREIVQNRTVLGGISYRLEQLIRDRFGFNARAENLGISQRSLGCGVSGQDRLEAYDAGRYAAQLLESENTGVMVSLRRVLGEPYVCEFVTSPLHRIAARGERRLPQAFIDDPRLFYDWLTPLLGEPIASYPMASSQYTTYPQLVKK